MHVPRIKNKFLCLIAMHPTAQRNRNYKIKNQPGREYTMVNPLASAPTAIEHTHPLPSRPPTHHRQGHRRGGEATHPPPTPAVPLHGEATHRITGWGRPSRPERGRPLHRPSRRGGGLPPSPHCGEATQSSLTMGGRWPCHFEEWRLIRLIPPPVGREAPLDTPLWGRVTPLWGRVASDPASPATPSVFVRGEERERESREWEGKRELREEMHNESCETTRGGCILAVLTRG